MNENDATKPAEPDADQLGLELAKATRSYFDLVAKTNGTTEIAKRANAVLVAMDKLFAVVEARKAG